MNFPKLYPIVNLEDEYQLDYIKNLLIAGIEILQIRSKHIDENKLLEFTKRAIDLRNSLNSKCKIIINDYVQIAKYADGLHLGQGDCKALDARIELGKDKIIGLSNHNLEQIKEAPLKELNYLALGPIFHSPTKSGHAPLVGLEMLREAKKLNSLPLVAIGGISHKNSKEVYKHGADCIAGISDFKNEIDLESLVLKYKATELQQ